MKFTLDRTLPNAHEVDISGATYPTPPLRRALAGCIQMLMVALLLLLALSLNVPFLPARFREALQPRRGAIIVGVFLCNVIASAIVQTGAFEVYVDGKLVYSKLSSGTVPTPEHMQRLILEATLLAT